MIIYYSGALYREIVRQNTGLTLSFIIAAVTKEKYPEFALLQIPNDELDTKLQFLQEYLPHLQAIKQGKIEPVACGKCSYCISKKKVEKIYYYDDFFNERNK